MPSVVVFLRDPNPYLSEFQRKPRKTPNDEVDKRERVLNPATAVDQLWAQNHSTTGGGADDLGALKRCPETQHSNFDLEERESLPRFGKSTQCSWKLTVDWLIDRDYLMVAQIN